MMCVVSAEWERSGGECKLYMAWCVEWGRSGDGVGMEWGRSVNFISHGAWRRCGVGAEWGRSVNFTRHGMWSRCGVGAE